MMSAHAESARPEAGGDRPARRLSPRRPGARATSALSLAGLCLLALALTWVVAYLLPAGQVRDATALHEFTLLSRPHVDAVANGLLNLLDPLPLTMAAAALIVVALARGRARLALAVGLVLAPAPLSAELLKPVLAHSHASVDPTHVFQASCLSGHAPAALALALCALLVAPDRLRPLVAGLGGLFVLSVGASLLILAWHLPSDVIGGYLLAGLWVALAVAGLRAADRSHASAGLTGAPV